MKKIILSTIMILSIVMINAQSVVSMNDQKFTFSTGEKDCIRVVFKDVSAKNLETAFKEYFSKNYKAKVSSVRKTNGEFEVAEFKAIDIQQRPTTITAVITELEGSAILYIHYMSDGFVVSEINTPNVYESYKKMTLGFANEAIKLSYANVMDMRSKELGLLESELDGMAKNDAKLAAAIVKMQSEIKTSEGEVSRLTTALTAQKAVIVENAKLVTDKETEMANLDVKSLEKDIKTIENDSKSADKEIAKMNSDIAKKNAEIAKLQSEIKTIESQIEIVYKRKETNAQSIAAVQTEINTHNEAALKEQLKLLQKNVKDAESEESNIAKSISKEAASIEKNKVEIAKTELEIANLKTIQDAKKAEITKTKEALKTIETKVSNVK